MEQVKGTPYFCNNVKKIKQYPYLEQNINCNILIIGGGIDGAIANYYLSKKYNVVLVEENRIGYQCTSCATALLEYQLDDFASDLTEVMTEQEIATIYQKGLYSIRKINDFIKQYGNHCDFYVRDTLVYSTKKKDIKSFEEEFKFRKKYNLDVELLDETQKDFPFSDFKVGLFCKNGGAEFTIPIYKDDD